MEIGPEKFGYEIAVTARSAHRLRIAETLWKRVHVLKRRNEYVAKADDLYGPISLVPSGWVLSEVAANIRSRVGDASAA